MCPFNGCSALESFEGMPCEDCFADTTGAVDHNVGWSVAGDRRFERVSKDIHLGVAMEEPIGEIGISEDVFVDNHNSELLRQSI